MQFDQKLWYDVYNRFSMDFRRIDRNMIGKASENWLIVGLGNPGKDYAHTRHNAGFRCLDILAENLGCKVDKLKFQGLYGQVN